ncbi:MAG: autotransporter-associated beta strand repeat-containing protein [Verrucomicrobiaceae bacterium]
MLLVILFALSPSLFAQAQPAADPAAHTVIVPYDPKKPLEEQKAERFYLGYDDFQRLWKAAKENRRVKTTDDTQEAVIHSALYQGRIEERGLVLEARITATTRGAWTKLALPFVPGTATGKAAPALVGEVRADGKAAALNDGSLTLENAGAHVIELTMTLPLSQDWLDLTLQVPPSLSGMLALRTPKSDGWLRVNDTAASAVEELTDARLFTQTLGAHHELHLQRSSRGLERGEGPVPSANVRGTITLRELEPESLDAEVEYEFPGAVRHTLEFSVDAPEGGGGLEIGSLDVFTTIPGPGEVRIPTQLTQTRREGGKLVFTLTLRHEASHNATIRISRAQRHLHGAGVRSMPLIQPLAQRVKQEIAVLHDDTMKVQVRGGAAQRVAGDARSGGILPPSEGAGRPPLLDEGRWQWSNGSAPTYDVTAAALFADADVSYVFQVTEQKAELLAALTLKRKSGVWTRAAVGLPVDYEVQAVQGPALTAWQHEGTQLYLHLNPQVAGTEARVVVHLARVATQAVTSWTLEPLKLENYEKVGGKALIVAHAANEVRLPDLTQRDDLKELDASVLDSVFAIAPPMEKKRALQHEGVSWKVDVALARQASRYSADAVLLVLASDAGIRVSQQVSATVEQGALRQISVRLPATLPEAVVSGPLLRETRSRIEGAERVYECSFQTEVLDHAELTFDHDLPLTAELEVPFVKVPGAGRLARWFALDNGSAREAKIATQTALETVSREEVPYLPEGMARPQFFRATGDGALKLAYQQLTSTEGNAALVTLADLTTILRADGERWDIAQFSLINRSLQFLPVILPEGAELISVNVSGEPVRADEETKDGKRVRLIPLIHTRPGQRALEVKMIYRFIKGEDGLKSSTTLDDPELVGLSVERTAWTVWTPKGWKLDDFDGNMTETAAEGRELQQLEGMLSELGDVNRTLASGKLSYGDAEAAYSAANELSRKVQEKKAQIASKVGRGTLILSGRTRFEGEQIDRDIQQQGALLKGNWDNNYAGKKMAGKDASGQALQGSTNWAFNKSAPQEREMRQQGANTFSGTLMTNGGQLFNDNVAVDNSYFANGLPQQPTVGTRSGQIAINNNSIDNLLITNNAATATQPMAGAAGGVVKTGAGTFVLNGANTYTGATTINGGAMVVQNGSSNISSNARGNNLSQTAQVDIPQMRGTIAGSGAVTMTANSPVNAPQNAAVSSLSLATTPQTIGALNPMATPAAPMPALASDPFSAPAAVAPPPPPMPGKPMELPAADDAKKKEVAKDGDGTLVLAQTVESLRPTGRRALDITLPMDGEAHHFSKLKDHAVLEIEIERVGDSRTISRVLCLAGGLLLWGAAWWWTTRRQGKAVDVARA